MAWFRLSSSFLPLPVSCRSLLLPLIESGHEPKLNILASPPVSSVVESGRGEGELQEGEKRRGMESATPGEQAKVGKEVERKLCGRERSKRYCWGRIEGRRQGENKFSSLPSSATASREGDGRGSCL